MYQNYGSLVGDRCMRQVFLGNVGSAEPASPAIYNIPSTAHFIHIFCLGGGGGGGGGGANAAGSAAGGGKGGGSASMCSAIFPAYLLPKTLYVFPGRGGLGGNGQVQGGAGSTSGGDGTLSRVALVPVANVAGNSSNFLIASGAVQATGGQNGSGATAGTTGGAAGAAASSANHQWGAGFFNVAIAGIAGTNGGSGAAGTAISYSGAVQVITTGGTGGGGTNAGTTTAAGGAITGLQDILVTRAGGIADGGEGTDGLIGTFEPGLHLPFYNCGGTGGGSNTSAGTGGRGGNGGIGCGGGGGGGTNGASSVGGAGGNGGPGLIIITAW